MPQRRSRRPGQTLRGRMLDGVLSTYFVELLEFDGEDLRGRPLTARKEVLARLPRGMPAGIILNAHYEKPTARSRTPCALGCRGIVSKRLGSP
jgi:ATP-dependent DNA ligase